MSDPTPTLAHEPDAERYTASMDGRLVGALDYSVLGSRIALTRAFTSPPFRGRGIAADLVRFAVDDIERSGDLRIVPSCWYVAQWFDEHPERSELLTR